MNFKNYFLLGLLLCGISACSSDDPAGPEEPVLQKAKFAVSVKNDQVAKRTKAGNTDYDFIGICSNGVDCIYFVLENGKFYIDFEAMGKEQLPYIDTLKQFAKEHNYPIVETTYNNTPVDYEHLKYAPVLSLKVHADIDSIVKVGSQIEHTIFRNNERTVYEIVP